MIPVFKRLDKTLQAFLRYLCIALFIALGLILMLNVGLRLINDLSIFLDRHSMPDAAGFVKSLAPLSSMHWFDEIVELCFAALVFYGAAALWGLKGHFCVGDWISKRLPNDTARAVYKLIVSLISASFIAVFFYFSLRLTMQTIELSTVFQIPKSIIYSCMPISSFLMLIYSTADVVLDLKVLFGGGEGSGERTSQSM